MESLQQNDQNILTRSSNSTEIHSNLPDDLIIEILLRLPTKSLARCRCVSKLWASLLRSQDFTETFLKRSSSRPLLLFACRSNDGKVFFFSSPQPQNPDENSSSIATANYHMSFPCDIIDIVEDISGLVYIRERQVLNESENVFAWKICNPSTGQYFTLPEMKTQKEYGWVNNYLGYDPVEKQVKVLRITDAIPEQHQVLTLETDKMSWRTTECGTPHSPSKWSVCINGVLYYKASNPPMIVCFDVRSEKYNFIRVSESSIGPVHPRTTLINYNGKLASLTFERYYHFGEASVITEIWVLQDPEKQEWSKHTYKLPISGNEVRHDNIYSVKVTHTNEIVLLPIYLFDPFYVVYISLERETITRVEIRGMSEFKGKKVFTFLDHIEDVKLM